jgi:flagellar biosynthetic protein FliQ
MCICTSGNLERFRAKRKPVRVKKMRQKETWSSVLIPPEPKSSNEFSGSLLSRRPGMTKQIDPSETTMTGAETLDVAREAIWTIIVVSSPMLVVGLVVGVVISLFQALTSIQEQTLVSVPKILAIFVTLLLALPFMADALHSEMMRISSRIISG